MINIDDIRINQGKEIALIILTCRVYFKTAEEDHIQEYIRKNEINWDLFLLSCSLHGIRPIVYKTIINTSIPSEIKVKIKSGLVFLAAKSWNFALETERIVKLLNSYKIKALPYKGVAFSKQFFGDLISRESSDIDLTIEKKDLLSVIKIMEDDGYLTDNAAYNYLGHRYTEEYKDLCFNKFKNKIRLFHIEFHWSVAERYFSMDKKVTDLFNDPGNNLVLFRKPIISLNANKHFVAVLINHIWRDIFKDIKALIDLGKCLQDDYSSFDWDDIQTHIENLNLKNGFSISVIVVKELFGIRNTACVPSKVEQKVINRFIAQSLRVYPTGHFNLRSKTFFLSQLLLRENMHDKLHFSLAFLRHCFYPTEIDFQYIKLPRYLFFVYPLLKPVRFLFKRTNRIESKKKLIPND